MNKVHTGTNQFCGPAVLSIITGKSVDDCAGLFAQHKGVSDVKEITYADMHAILTKLRYKFTDIATDCSLYSCMVQVSSKPGFYIVGLPKHVGALEVVSSHEIYFCDNHTKEPIRGSSSARMSQRVDKLIRVELKPEPKLIGTEIVTVINEQSYMKDSVRFSISRYETYENPEDNVEIGLGTFYLKNKDEVSHVVEALSRYAKTIHS
jgi:hypothetical protein